jgi:hypothetical protein
LPVLFFYSLAPFWGAFLIIFLNLEIYGKIHTFFNLQFGVEK